MRIPVETLSAAALQGIVETFVLREGTEYGAHDHSLAGKCAEVVHALRSGRAQIDYDPVTDSVNILPTEGAPTGD